MAKIKEVKHINENTGEIWHHQFLYWCSGCGYEHAFDPKIHRFNCDLNKPTISPSLLENRVPNKVCHSFIKDGHIQYLNDCHHALAGQTVDLLDVDVMMDMRLQKAKNSKP